MGFEEGALDGRLDGDRFGVVVGMLEGILDRRLDDAPVDGLQVSSTVGAADDGLPVGTTVGDRLKACTEEGSSQMGVDPG